MRNVLVVSKKPKLEISSRYHNALEHDFEFIKEPKCLVKLTCQISPFHLLSKVEADVCKQVETSMAHTQDGSQLCLFCCQRRGGCRFLSFRLVAIVPRQGYATQLQQNNIITLSHVSGCVVENASNSLTQHANGPYLALSPFSFIRPRWKSVKLNVVIQSFTFMAIYNATVTSIAAFLRSARSCRGCRRARHRHRRSEPTRTLRQFGGTSD